MKLLNSSKVVLFLILFLAIVFNVQPEEEVDIWKKNKQKLPNKPMLKRNLMTQMSTKPILKKP